MEFWCSIESLHKRQKENKQIAIFSRQASRKSVSKIRSLTYSHMYYIILYHVPGYHLRLQSHTIHETY